MKSQRPSAGDARDCRAAVEDVLENVASDAADEAHERDLGGDLLSES